MSPLVEWGVGQGAPVWFVACVGGSLANIFSRQHLPLASHVIAGNFNNIIVKKEKSAVIGQFGNENRDL